MNFIESVRAWWQGIVTSHNKKVTQKRESEMVKESCNRLQVMEFNGSLYIAYNGAPVVRVDRLNVEPAKLLTEARKDFVAWRKQFGGRYGCL